MPQKLALTDQTIRKITVPSTGTDTYWDSATRGFGVRVSAGGTKSFIVLIASGRRQSLGHYPELPLTRARSEAKRILAEKTLGKIKPTHSAFDDAKRDYIAEMGQHLKPGTLAGYQYLLDKHLSFGRKSIADITPYELSRILNRLTSKPSLKHHVFTAGRAFFAWARDNQLIENNPFERIGVPNPTNSRERVLTDKEHARVLKLALAGTSSFHSIVVKSRPTATPFSRPIMTPFR